MREAQRIAGLGIHILDLSTGAWTASDILREILGVGPEDDLSFERWRDLIHPEDREIVDACFSDKALRKGQQFEVEHRIIRQADRAVRWVHGRGRVERDENGNPVKLRGIIQDITERKQAEAALRESKELLQLFIEHAPAALAMFDREMRYLAVSRRWLDIHSLHGREMIGRSHYEIFPGLPESWIEEHRRALAGEIIVPGEASMPREDGSLLWVRRKIRPWFTADGAVGGIILFSEDITERIQAEAALRESKDLLQLFVEHAPVALAMFDRDMRYLAVSRRWASDHSIAENEIIGAFALRGEPGDPGALERDTPPRPRRRDAKCGRRPVSTG